MNCETIQRIKMRLMDFAKSIGQGNESPIIHANDSPSGKVMLRNGMFPSYLNCPTSPMLDSDSCFEEYDQVCLVVTNEN